MVKARNWVGLLALACLTGCSDRNEPAPSVGQLVIEGELDQGEVPLHAFRERTVRLRNVGRGPLAVEELWTIAPYEGLSAQAQEALPRVLATGEELAVTVRFEPRREGDYSQWLWVRTDNSGQSLSKAQLLGRGILAAALVDRRHLDFGRIEADSSKSLWLEVHNPSPFGVQLRSRLVGADKDELSMLDGVELPAGERKTLEVKFEPHRVAVKQLALSITPCNGCPDEIVSVFAEAIEQAVIAEPPELDFGQVAIDRQARELLWLHNVSTEPMRVSGGFLAPGTDPSFVLPAAPPLTLAPDQRVAFELFYSPGHMGLARGRAHFVVESVRHPTTEAVLLAFGGASELCVVPEQVSYGTQPVGSRTERSLTLRNCGSAGAPPLTVTEVSLEPAADGADTQYNLGAIVLPVTIAAGQSVQARVFFEPERAGTFVAAAKIKSQAGSAGLARVRLEGTAQAHEPCQVALTPLAVNFGTVAPGRGAVLGIKLENTGSDLCAVKNVRLANDGGGAFLMPGGAIEGLVVPPGNAFSFQVAFVPQGNGQSLGELQLQLSDPANPLRQVPLFGNCEAACLWATPEYLDFGFARPDCPPGPLRTSLSNICAQPLGLQSVFLGPGTTDSEFELTAVPGPLPRVLDPGASVSVEARYKAAVAGMNLSPLFVEVTGMAAPLLVPLLGEASLKALQTDRFIQQDGKKSDVLLVIDNTASMVEEQPKLLAALGSFINLASSRGVDLHLAVTTTGIAPVSAACPGGAFGGEAGRFFPADGSAPRLLTSNMPDLGQALRQNTQVGLCAFVEQGMEAMRRALSPPLVNQADDPRTRLPNDGNAGFLRDEAALLVIFIGDEDDHSPDLVETYARFLSTLKGAQQPGRAIVYAIAPDGAACANAGGVGDRYAQLAQRTGGQALSICAADYAPLLTTVANRAFSLQDRFSLSQLPDPSTIVVNVNGAVSRGWSYDPVANQIVFVLPPPAGARLEVSYRKQCP